MGWLRGQIRQMEKRVIRDIRHYEQKPGNYTGKFDGILGNVYKGSFEIKCIGQRIARKLNELKFISGDFDHLYIDLTNKLDRDVIIERDYEQDKQIKYFDFGQGVEDFNDLTNKGREDRITEITFKVLKWKFGQNENDKVLIESVEKLIQNDGRKILINYKDKETKDYKLNIGFQIAPTDNKSKIVIDYLVKKDNKRLRGDFDLKHYEEIYYLVDKISSDGQRIRLQPKKSMRAGIATAGYKTPVTIDIKDLKTID